MGRNCDWKTLQHQWILPFSLQVSWISPATEQGWIINVLFITYYTTDLGTSKLSPYFASISYGHWMKVNNPTLSPSLYLIFLFSRIRLYVGYEWLFSFPSFWLVKLLVLHLSECRYSERIKEDVLRSKRMLIGPSIGNIPRLLLTKSTCKDIHFGSTQHLSLQAIPYQHNVLHGSTLLLSSHWMQRCTGSTLQSLKCCKKE